MANMTEYIYWRWDGVLSKDFCQLALNSVNWEDACKASVRGDARILDPKSRISEIIWQDRMQPLGCVTNSYFEAANINAGWNFDITLFESVQLSKYTGENKGHYDWHVDCNPPKEGVQRKLTCVILLNDPSEFEGGELQFEEMDGVNMLTKQGSIIVFPSFLKHKVTPVTKGVRYTAVTWASGPAFK
jgi:PKHD-type hydroxylase